MNNKTNYLKLQPKLIGLLKETLDSGNLENLKSEFEVMTIPENEKKIMLEQSFRDLMIQEYIDDIPAIEKLIKLTVETCKANLCSHTLPVYCLADCFDIFSLDNCEKLFTFVEENVSVFKDKDFFASCKNQMLRMCNDLLRKLSRSQNTVFCGRILLFLAKFFPFSERSGLNIVSEFNVDNVTEYGSDELTESLELTENPLKIDYNLYCKFWSLQEFFRCPYICYDKTNWKKFTSHSAAVLAAFSSFKLEESDNKASQSKDTDKMEVDKEEVEESQHFFAKFLTNPKLLALQLSDSNFRRSILVQYLILFHYLNSTVKFKSDSDNLSASQTEWITENEATIYELLRETPPNGKKFADAVKHMLKREELWNNWKNDGCKEITRPDPDYKPSPPKRQKKLLGDLINDSNKQGKFYMGSPELTRLWNLCPDNLQACKGVDRNFLPTLETYLDSPKEKEKSDPSFEWRALRLLARQSPHFFSLSNTPSCKIADLLEVVYKKIQKEKVEIKVEPEDAKQEAEEENFEHEETEPLDEPDQELTPEDKNAHKTISASEDQILEISKAVGADWKKLGAKLGYLKDVLDFYEDGNKDNPTQCCKKMLTIWFGEDEDANLDNLAYILEGLKIQKAIEVVKDLLGMDKVEEISE